MRVYRRRVVGMVVVKIRSSLLSALRQMTSRASRPECRRKDTDWLWFHCWRRPDKARFSSARPGVVVPFVYCRAVCISRSGSASHQTPMLQAGRFRRSCSPCCRTGRVIPAPATQHHLVRVDIEGESVPRPSSPSPSLEPKAFSRGLLWYGHRPDAPRHRRTVPGYRTPPVRGGRDQYPAACCVAVTEPGRVQPLAVVITAICP